MNFLDVKVKVEHMTLTTVLHVKPTDTHQYLAPNTAATHDTARKPSLTVKFFA